MSDRLADLADLRELLWDSIREAPADKRASLAKQLTDVVEQIDRLTPAEKVGDPVDEIAKRRAARGAGSATSQRRPTADEG